jgi:hypothetical protein
MESELPRWATLVIALWGALTGTAALVIEFRQIRRDRPHIVVNPSYERSYSDSFPPKITLIVTVANTGRRPVFLDEIWIRAAAPSLVKEVVWRARGRGWIPLRHSHLGRTQLSEGQSEEFRLELPVNLGPHQVRQIRVHDQSGREWLSPQRFDQRKIGELLKSETIAEETVRGSDDIRSVYVQRVRTGKRQGVLIRVTEGNTTRWQFPRFTSPEQAEDTALRAIELAKLFVERKSDEDILARLGA